MAAPGPRLLTDDELRRLVEPAAAVECMRQAVVAAHEQRLSAPPRVHTDLGEGRLVFTTGALADSWYGYRSYDTFEHATSQQVVVLHSAATGEVQAVAVGELLGPLRTGALGGLAVDLLARTEASTLGLVGAGVQAWTQLWAVASVRELRDVRVYARTPGRADDFAERARTELGLPCVATRSAEEAVRDRDIVVLATTSRTPVVDPAWLSPGCHVTTLGPKQVGRAEFDIRLLDAAAVLATDSPAQLDAYDPPSVAKAAGHTGRLVSLGELAAGQARSERTPGTTVYLSVGLAGTEVALLSHAAAVAGSGLH